MASVFTSNDLDHVLEVPRGFFKRPFGFSLDIGGSCAKLAYYDVTDPDNGAEVTKIHLVLFKEDETGKVCDHLMQKFSLPGNPDWADHVVYTTGIGGSQYIKIFKEKLGVTIRNINEMDCFAKAFRTLLDTLDTNKFVLEKSEEAVAKAMERLEIRKMAMEEWRKTSGMDSKEETKPEEDVSQEKYPCGVCIVGSGGGLLKMEEASDGFGLIAGIIEAGRAFIGIGSLLTGKKSYGEIMEAAEKGSIDDVCVMSTDFRVDDDAEGVYSIVNKIPKVPTFLFGKAVGKTVGDFKPEDMARTWVYLFTRQLGNYLPFMAKVGGVKQIYFSGNFFNHRLIRDDITEAVIANTLGQNDDLKFDFIRFGGHYGSIGALMEDNLSEEFDVTLRRKKAATK